MTDNEYTEREVRVTRLLDVIRDAAIKTKYKPCPYCKCDETWTINGTTVCKSCAKILG